MTNWTAGAPLIPGLIAPRRPYAAPHMRRLSVPPRCRQPSGPHHVQVHTQPPHRPLRGDHHSFHAVLSLATVLVARDNTFDQVDHNIGQITRNHANELSACARQAARHQLAEERRRPARSHRAHNGRDRAAGRRLRRRLYRLRRQALHLQPRHAGWLRRPGARLVPAGRPDQRAGHHADLCGRRVGQAVHELRRGGARTAAWSRPWAPTCCSTAWPRWSRPSRPRPRASPSCWTDRARSRPTRTSSWRSPVTAIDPGLDLGQLQQLARNSGSSLTQDIGGVSQLLYASAVEGTPWTLVIAIDRAQANEPVTMMVKLAASITALALLLAVAS